MNFLLVLLFGASLFTWWMYTIVGTYYSDNAWHEKLISLNPNNLNDSIILSTMTSYFIVVAFVYIIYKIVSLIAYKKEISFSFLGIIGFIVLQIMLVSIFYSIYQAGYIEARMLASGASGADITHTIRSSLGNASSIGAGFTLFFHIVQFLLYPVFLIFLWRGVGYQILSHFSYWKNYTLRFKIPVEIALGLGIFTLGLLILAAFHLYTLIGLGILCILLLLLSWRGALDSLQKIWHTKIKFPQHTTSKGILRLFQPKLLSIELAFIILSFAFAASLISILRPMPIGWDDLGVYMNYPKIMAHNATYLQGASMFSWQLITGTGFLFFNTAAQAFFINQIGGVLAVIAITCLLSTLLEKKGREYLISLPILFASIYYLMPMTVFQQAKDMKLDPALMFVSVSAMMTLWYGLKALLKEKTPKKGLPLILLAGALVGIAFGVKFTSLLLVISGLGYISYRALGIFGFAGFWGIFIALFTVGNLWSRMFIWLPTDNTALINAIIFGSAGIGVVSLLIGASLHKKNTLPWLRGVLVFILGVGISLLPWLIKNGSEAQIWSGKSDIVSGLLGGKNQKIYSGYESIYTPEEIETRKEKLKEFSNITEDGASNNEDFSRYFGQEKGLNNYIKLPTNLTIQKNQGGEFTDITYIFLLLVPIAGLFVRSRKGFKVIWLGGNLLCIALIYGLLKSPDFEESISPTLSSLILPQGYLVLLGVVFLWQIFVHLLVESSHTMSRRYKFMSFFVSTYALLFLVSAFGIVWYGVLVYFMFFVLISLGFSEAISISKKDTREIIFTKGLISLLLFISIAIYLTYSAPRHIWKNLSTSGYNEYKYNLLNQEETIFAYRSDYINSIAAMNLKNPNAIIEKSMEAFAETGLKEKLPDPDHISVFEYSQMLRQLENLAQKNATVENLNMQKNIQKAKDILYGNILYPSDTDANDGGIYRIGTFMTYFINNNRQRFFEDSLVKNFEAYFYDENPDTTIERMKNIGLKYLLVDLNAATIDRDSRHALTERYEHLLLSMRSQKLKLIDTDSFCLRFAVDMNAAGSIQNDTDFLMIAGNNFVSYDENDNQISQSVKMNTCINAVRQVVNSVSEEKLPTYLQNSLESIQAAGNDNTKIAQALGITQSYFVLFEIR